MENLTQGIWHMFRWKLMTLRSPLNVRVPAAHKPSPPSW